MEATLQHVDGLTFIGRSGSGHAIVFDGAIKDREGNVIRPAAAPGPMEAVLMALGGCSGMDVASILQKKRVKPERFEIRLKADRAAEHPKVFTKIQMEYVFSGKDLPRKALEDACRLSFDKYCSVAGMLKEVAEVTYAVVLEE